MKSIIIIVSLILQGCTIYQGHLAEAEAACKDHGGIFSITVDQPFVDVTCRDGTYFDDVKNRV